MVGQEDFRDTSVGEAADRAGIAKPCDLEVKRLNSAAVRETLVKSGIDGSRIATAGYGPERPIATNDTEEGRAKNRRLELVVEKR